MTTLHNHVPTQEHGNDQLNAHLRELAEIADLAQREPLEALMRVLVTEPQPGAREIRMAVLIFCEGLAVMYDMEDEAGGHWDDLSEGGTA